MSPSLLLFVICAVTVVLFLAAAAKWKKDAANNSEDEPQQVAITHPYVRKGALLTAAERSFLGVLEKIVGDRFRIYAQVRLADVISIRPGTEKRQRQMALNRITSKHVDFVVCEKFTLEVLCAIELDDSTHSKEDRMARDRFVEGVLHTANLPLVRVVARAGYQPDEVRKSLEKVLGPLNAETAVSHESTTLEAGLTSANVDFKGKEVAEIIQQAKEPLGAKISPTCPKCAGPTVLRTVKAGVRAQSKLWGCVKYPGCRGMIPAPSEAVE